VAALSWTFWGPQGAEISLGAALPFPPPWNCPCNQCRKNYMQRQGVMSSHRMAKWQLLMQRALLLDVWSRLSSFITDSTGILYITKSVCCCQPLVSNTILLLLKFHSVLCEMICRAQNERTPHWTLIRQKANNVCIYSINYTEMSRC